MGEIIDYCVVAEESFLKLENSVKMHISGGWQPIGGICDGSLFIYQAMVKYKEQK